LRKSIGTVTLARCSARFGSGAPAGCRGNAKSTKPLTFSSKDSEAAVVVILPLKECPPARSGRSGAALWAALTADLIVSTQTGLESRPRLFSEYGKLYRNVAMPCRPSASAIDCIIGVRIFDDAP